MILQAWEDSGCNSEVGNIWYHSWCRGDTVRWYSVYNLYTVIYTRCSGDTTPLTVCIHCCAAAAVGKLFEFIRHFVAVRFRNCPFWRSYTPDTGWHQSSQGLHWSQAVCVMAHREKIVSVLEFGISAQYSHFFQLAADDGLVNLPIMILYRIPIKTFASRDPSSSHHHHQYHHRHFKVEAITTLHSATIACNRKTRIAADVKRQSSFLCIGFMWWPS